VNKTLACSLLAGLCLPAHAVAGSGAVRSTAFLNTEPLAAQQWYLEQDRAWDQWPDPPNLAPVRVAVIDSGIDYSHPEFVGRVVTGISFVGGSWKRDTDGHGTFVAGEIAANPFNGAGIAGLAFNARLLIAKVVPDGPDGSVSLPAEIRAIYWAVDHGARVINLSIGGVRDPVDSGLDSFSLKEQAAVEYAYSKGALVVAAVGNGTQAPRTPWNFADYPAALPHVLGVSALRQNGSVPDYSNRDVQYADIAAPGDAIFSTVPRNLVDTTRPDCVGVPYSNCGPFEFQSGIGTSFAAPQVSAAAVLLLGMNPKLTPDQLEWLLERTAVDVNPDDGCNACAVGRDSLTGWGRLNIAAALAGFSNGTRLPQPDAYEPNDGGGQYFASAFGPPRTITATLDYWDDPVDVYSIKLAKGQELFGRLTQVTNAPTTLMLWRPGTATVDVKQSAKTDRLAQSVSVAGQQRLSYRAPVAGTYYLEVRIKGPRRSVVEYRLAVATVRAGT
jgi:subtilisin family serine protease